MADSGAPGEEISACAFDYHLPPDRIAQSPCRPRDHARLMIVRRQGPFEHRRFCQIKEYLQPGDMLVLNDTRVIRARLLGTRVPGGGKVELLLLRRHTEQEWEALIRPGRAGRIGARVRFGEGISEAQVVGGTAYGGGLVKFEGLLPGEGLLQQFGLVPTPPYIHRTVTDSSEYQTVYARSDGSAAAPTAGLHFTSELLSDLRGQGIRLGFVTLHVGIDTFRPIKTERLDQHVMHREYYEIPQTTKELIEETRRQGGRIIAVGTTTVRALESSARCECGESRGGWTELFIRPGFQFLQVDALITNFHLPRSSLLVLVSAFSGRARILSAYQEALRENYRFYSFGDAMLLLR